MKKSKSKREAKFFCEFCGDEVPRNARTCPKCGKFFASVRCPKCGKTGSTDEFKKGCPACGYAVHSGIGRGSGGINYSSSDNGFFGRLFGSNSRKNHGADAPLPVWIYIVCVAILIGLVVLLYSCL